MPKKQSSNYQQLINTTLRNRYPYLLLGATVVIVIILMVISFFSSNKPRPSPTISPTNIVINQPAETKPEAGKKYTVKAGDNLWQIAEATYGSGYNDIDIAKANQIANPDVIEIGQILVLPSVTPKTPTIGDVAPAATTDKMTFTGNQYTIKAGDNLWNIAVSAYGDGYAWVRIAEANHLTNPNLIHIGNTLTIPR